MLKLPEDALEAEPPMPPARVEPPEFGVRRTRGVDGLVDLARPESFNLWTLPITALRLTPPNLAAI